MENLARVATAELLNALDSRKRSALRLALEGAVRGLPGAEDCALALVRRSKTCVRGLRPLAQDLREALTTPSASPSASPRVSPHAVPRAAPSPRLDASATKVSPRAAPSPRLSPDASAPNVSPRAQDNASPRLPRTPPLSAPSSRQIADAERLRVAEEREQRALVVAAEEAAFKEAQAHAAKRQEPPTAVAHTVATPLRTPLNLSDQKARGALSETPPHDHTVASLRDQLSAANTKLALESQERTRLAAQVESLSAELHGAHRLQMEYEALRQLSAALQSENATLTARLSAVNAGDSAVSGELAKAKAKLAYAQERIEDLRRALS